MPPRHAPQPSRSRQALGNSQPSPEMISVQKPRQRCVPANAHGGALPNTQLETVALSNPWRTRAASFARFMGLDRCQPICRLRPSEKRGVDVTGWASAA